MAGTLQGDISKIVATLAELYDVQADGLIASLLRESRIELEQTEYDNWNGGTYGYALHLKASPRRFAELGDRVPSLEKQILEKLKLMTRAYSNEYLGIVILTPSLDALDGAKVIAQEPAFWTSGYFKLFVSHVSLEKAKAAAVAQALREYGVSGFVAHEDIEPTKDWPDEIILALNTMDALLALLSPGFEASKWADQEVGVAIGRGVLVVPARMGVDPYGFIGRFQAFAVGDKIPSAIATEIARILAAHQQSRLKMAHAIVTAFSESNTFAEAKTRAGHLSLISTLPQNLKERLRAAVESNDQIKDAWGVSQRVEAVVARFE